MIATIVMKLAAWLVISAVLTAGAIVVAPYGVQLAAHFGQTTTETNILAGMFGGVAAMSLVFFQMK